jgi:FPC/CPF motif-containing protein YcgG
MSFPYFGRHEIEDTFGPQSWQAIVFKEFSSALTSTARPFPCIFGAAGFAADQLRYAFLDQPEAPKLAPILQAYLKEARSFGQNTSLVVFSMPGPVRSLESYRKRFWSLLRNLSHVDPAPWPAAIPERLDDPAWEFCFAGEPIFVVCNTPAHVLRQSRRASTFMLTFQPRWVFENILGTAEAAERSFGKVRKRLASYDMLPPSPVLGQYGDPGVYEHQQYFLDESNDTPKCPFAALKNDRPSPDVGLDSMEKVA